MKLARHDNTICHICNKAILLNEEIFPFLKVFDYDSTLTNYKLIFSKKIFSWCHINCVCKILKCKDKKCLVKPLCPFYAKNQYCGYGSSCFYRHVNVDDSIFCNVPYQTLGFSIEKHVFELLQAKPCRII